MSILKSLFPLILLIGFTSCNAQSQKENEEKLRLKINTELDKNISECSFEINAITNFNGNIEFWSICNLLNDNRIFKVEFYRKDTYYQEIYFENNGNLIYAKETENYIPKNHFTQMNWNCEFYVKNGKLVSLISLGHGKSEDEEWNPEIIFEMYNKRLLELKKIEK